MRETVVPHFFLDALRDSRLLTDDQLADVARRITDEFSAERITHELVEQEWLTPFQAKRLRAGQGKGLVLGQYRLLEELGRGGFGHVYKAIHGIMNRIVALKVIAPELVENSRARTWFLREVLATTQLCHPNIVMAYDANEVDGVLFLAMEYVEGRNLHQLVKRQGPLPIGLAFTMLHQVGRALQCAHEQGLVHRDIKPANLLIPHDATASFRNETAAPGDVAASANRPLVKVADFGLARLQATGGANTLMLHTGSSFAGTPDYVSPEQARNVHDADIRSDLYSLGCTFYFALTGQAPFRGESGLEIVVQHLEREPEPLEHHRPEIPPALSSIVRRLMAKKPEQRFQSPALLLAELGFLVGSQPLVLLPAVPSAIEPAGDAPDLPATRIVLESSAAWDVDSCADDRLVPAAAVNVECTDPAGAGATNRAEPDQVPPVSPSGPKTQTYEAPTAVAEAGTASAGSPNRLTEFCETWLVWTDVLTGLLRGEPHGVSEASYRLVHARLLETCRARSATAPEPLRSLLQQLECVAAPWLSVETLAMTDRDTLISLERRCRELSQQLGLRRSSRRSWLWIAGILFLVAVGVLCGMLTSRTTFLRMRGELERLVTSNPLLFLALIAPIVVLGVIYLFSRVGVKKSK